VDGRGLGLIWDIIKACAYNNLKLPKSVSVETMGGLVENRMEHLPVTGQKLYEMNQLDV
jgi:Mg2+/Co2+ transporter CorC